MNKQIVLEVVGKNKDLTYLYGNKQAELRFSQWLEKGEHSFSKTKNHILVRENDLINYVTEAILCGLRPSRQEIFSAI